MRNPCRQPHRLAAADYILATVDKDGCPTFDDRQQCLKRCRMLTQLLTCIKCKKRNTTVRTAKYHPAHNTLWGIIDHRSGYKRFLFLICFHIIAIYS